MIYLINIMITTSQDRYTVGIYCVYVLLSEIITDSMKHFFVTRLNKLETSNFYLFKANLIKVYTDHKNIETLSYLKQFDWSLNRCAFDFESVLALSMNFNIIPQCVLIIRNVIFFTKDGPTSFMSSMMIVLMTRMFLKQVVQSYQKTIK